MVSSSRRGSGTIVLDGERLTLEQVGAVAAGASCRLAPAARSRVRAARRVVERAVASGEAVYGVNTGFGELARIHIDANQLERLQQNLVRSHAAGVGAPLAEPVVRAILALRANCLARGHSGLREQTLERLLDLLDAGICPVVPEQGSVGASGDLAPLAHVALALIGEGEVFHRGRRTTAAEALRRAGFAPLRLQAKEGLALINGTQMSTAIGVLTLLRAERLATLADVVGAMSLEALKGSHRAFDARIHDARPHPGQVLAAANLRRLLRGGTIARSHAECGRVQDCYSLRCMPQVHGAVRGALAHVRSVLEVEVNASTDNPMVFALSGDLVSGGNFHGHPVALALDHLAIATCSLGTISERRIDRLLNPALSGLPPFLAENPGLDSGLMMAHVTAAALVSENKGLAHPASVDTIPTSAGQEDHVPMAPQAARKAARIVDHVQTVLAIELLCATRALDLLLPLRGGRGVEAVRAYVRKTLPAPGGDRTLAPEIATAKSLLESPTLLRAAQAGGKLA
jgi:histidine ammonia-lyase